MRRILSILTVLCTLALPGLRSQDSKENADLKLALNLYNDKFYDLALEQFRQFVSFYPNSPQAIEARFYLGLTQSKLGLHDDARFTFQNFALSYPENPRAPEAWIQVAESFLAVSNRREAALAYERVRTFHPRSKQAPESLDRAASLFDEIGDRPNAIRALRILTQEYATADVVRARLRLAGWLVDAGQYDAAGQEARKVIEGTKESSARAEAQLVTARIAVSAGRMRAAEDAVQDIIKNYRTTPSLPQALFLLGEVKESTGDMPDAIAAWRSVAEDSAKASAELRQHAYIRVGLLLALRRDAAGAQRSYEMATRLTGPRRATAALQAGRYAELAGDTLTAAQWYDRAAEDTSSFGDPRARGIAGVKAALWLGRWDEVVRRATVAANEWSNDPAIARLLLFAAKAQETGLKDFRAAEAMYLRALEAPGTASVADEALYGAARCARQQGDVTDARERLEQCASRFPASSLTSRAAADLRSLELFDVRDREAGTEQLALLLGDVIGEQQRSAMAFRLGEISFTQLKNYELARTQYLRALRDGLEASHRPAAWLKAAQSAEYESLRPGTTRPVQDRLLGEAITLYDSLIAYHRDHPNTSVALLSVMQLRSSRAGSIAELRSMAQRVDSLFATERTRDRMFAALAERAEALRSVDDALAWWGRVSTITNDQVLAAESQFRSGVLLAARGDRDTALALLVNSAERPFLHQRSVQAAFLAASIAAVKGDRAMVDRLTDRAFRSAPYAVDPTSVVLLKADAAYAAQAWSAAADLYGRARTAIEQDHFTVRLMPAESAFRMAVACQRVGRNDEASRLYGEVVTREKDPQILLASYTALAVLAEARNDLPRASAYMQEAAQVSAAAGGDVNAVALESADLLFRNEQYAEAITRYSNLLSKSSSDSLTQRLETRIITSYLRVDNLREADRRIGTFVKKYPRAANDVAEFEFERGKHLLRKERTPLARERFELVVRQYPNAPAAPEAWYWLGRTYELEQEVPRAAEIYDSLLQRYPNHSGAARVRLSLGNALYALEQWERAGILFKAVLDDEARTPELARFAMNNLILTYKEQNLFDAALQLTRTYIEKYPDDPEIMNKRIDIGVLYQKLGYFDQSITHLQSLMQSAGSDLEAELRYYIGEAYHYKGDHQQAILEFLKVPYLVTQRGPVDWVSTSYYMAGQSYEKMSRFDQAVAMYRQIIERPGIDPSFKTAAQREIDRVNQLTGKRN